MKKVWAAFLISLAAFARLGAWQSPASHDQPPIKLIQTIHLPPAVKGNFDHFEIDLKNNRLFATPEDFKALLVLNTQTGELIHTIEGIERPHAVFYRSDLDRIYVTDGIAGDLKIFDGRTYRLLNSVKLLKDADSRGYDPSTKYLYIDNGGGDVGAKYSMLTSVDTTTGKKVADLAIDGETLEAMALDEYRPRLYVNNKSKNEVTVVDRWMNKIVTSWPIRLGRVNVAMALDEPHQRLFVACRSGQIVVVDTNTGTELQSLPIVKAVDDLVYDRGSKRLYAAGDGSVSVYREDDADHFKSLGNVSSGPLGRTAILVPELNRYFVAVPQHGAESAAVLVFEPSSTSMLAPASDPIAYEVHAPVAEAIVLETLSAHPDLRKMGLHAIAPGQTDSVIIANGNATRIGIKTTDRDFAAVKSGKTYCAKIDNGAFYNVKMQMFDASERRIGILVMEIPYTSAKDETGATSMAEGIRAGLQRKIPSLNALFAHR